MQTPMEPTYEDFEPLCKWKREKNSDTLEIHLPGFKRQQLKILLSSSGNLIITGERQMEEDKTKRSRFSKQFPVPAELQPNQIQAKFTGGVLYLGMPKQINVEASAGAGLSPTTDRKNRRTAMEIILVICLAVAVGAYVKIYCHCSHLWN